MPWALQVDVVDEGDETIKVRHVFFGETKDEAQTYKRHHMDSCSYFGPLVKEGRVAGTSFTFTASTAPVANPACLSYTIVN